MCRSGGWRLAPSSRLRPVTTRLPLPVTRLRYVRATVGGLWSGAFEHLADGVEHRLVRLLAGAPLVAHEAAVGSPQEQHDLRHDVVERPVRDLRREFEAELEFDGDVAERDLVHAGLARALAIPRSAVQLAKCLDLADRGRVRQQVVAELVGLGDVTLDLHLDDDGAERVLLLGRALVHRSTLVNHETTPSASFGIVLPFAISSECVYP